MFKINDYALFAARIIIFVLFCIEILLSLILGIWWAVKVDWTFIFLIFGGWIGAFIGWIFSRLLLSFFCDIKLIRNKLYDEDNKKLEVFYKSTKFLKINSRTDENFEETVNTDLETSENKPESVTISQNKFKEGCDSVNEFTEKTNKDYCNVHKNKVVKLIIVISSIIVSIAVIIMAVVLFSKFYNSFF